LGCCLSFCFLGVLGLFYLLFYFYYGFFFASPICARYSLSSLFWPLHFKQPLEACQEYPSSC
jgi:uncharacterized membrane protein